MQQQFNIENIYPQTIAYKIDPPTLAMFYKIDQESDDLREYSIQLNGLINISEVNVIVDKIYNEHVHMINRNILDSNQVLKLISKLRDGYFKQKQRYSLDDNIDEDQINQIKNLQIEDQENYEQQSNLNERYGMNSNNYNKKSQKYNSKIKDFGKMTTKSKNKFFSDEKVEQIQNAYINDANNATSVSQETNEGNLGNNSSMIQKRKNKFAVLKELSNRS